MSIMSMVVSVFYYGYLLPYPPTTGAMVEFWQDFGRFCGLPILLTILTAIVFVACILMHGIYMVRHGFEVPAWLLDYKATTLKERIKNKKEQRDAASAAVQRLTNRQQQQQQQPWQWHPHADRLVAQLRHAKERELCFEQEWLDLHMKQLQHERLRLPVWWWFLPLGTSIVCVAGLVTGVVLMYQHSLATYRFPTPE